MPTPFTAAVVQMRSGTDIGVNIDSMESLVRQAARAGVTYVQTPEMTGLVQQDRARLFDAIVVQSHDPVLVAARALAKDLAIYLHVGSTPVAVGDQRAANRAYLISPDGMLIAQYDKIHMFDVDLDNGEKWRESAVYEPGRKGVIAEVAGATVGLSICYDCRFPELHTAYARQGVDVLTAPSCFTRQTGKAHWHVLLRSRAIETGSFMIAAAQGGVHADGRETYGHSIIVNPWGEVIAEVDHDEPGIGFADIDLEQVTSARRKIPNLVNNKAFAIECQDNQLLRFPA